MSEHSLDPWIRRIDRQLSDLPPEEHSQALHWLPLKLRQRLVQRAQLIAQPTSPQEQLLKRYQPALDASLRQDLQAIADQLGQLWDKYLADQPGPEALALHMLAEDIPADSLRRLKEGYDLVGTSLDETSAQRFKLLAEAAGHCQEVLARRWRMSQIIAFLNGIFVLLVTEEVVALVQGSQQWLAYLIALLAVGGIICCLQRFN